MAGVSGPLPASARVAQKATQAGSADKSKIRPPPSVPFRNPGMNPGAEADLLISSSTVGRATGEPLSGSHREVIFGHGADACWLAKPARRVDPPRDPKRVDAQFRNSLPIGALPTPVQLEKKRPAKVATKGALAVQEKGTYENSLATPEATPRPITAPMANPPVPRQKMGCRAAPPFNVRHPTKATGSRPGPRSIRK